jgi:hypothetical protein
MQILVYPEKNASDKHSSLFVRNVSDEEKCFYNIGLCVNDTQLFSLSLTPKAK